MSAFSLMGRPVRGVLLALLGLPTAWAQEGALFEFTAEFGEQGFYIRCLAEDQTCYQDCSDPFVGCREVCTCNPGTTNSVPPEGFSSPTGIGWLDGLRLLVADQGNDKLQLCHLDGTCSWLGGDAVLNTRNGPGIFTSPHGLSVDDTGRFALADEGNHAVQICDAEGNCDYVGDRDSIAVEPSSIPGQWDHPQDAAFTADGRVYGLDTGNHRIQELRTPDWTVGGIFQFSEGSATGQFSTPRGMAIDGRDRFVIADTGNHRIQICELASNQLACGTEFGARGSAAGQFEHPAGVDVDALGRIWVADSGNHRIQVCDEQGACESFGEFGTAAGQFDGPEDLAVHSSGQVAVVDTGNHRIQLFRTESGCDSGLINAGLNDAWFNPATAGQGFFITVFPVIKKMFLANFTFETQLPDASVTAVLGAAEHRWVTAFGDYCGAQAVLAAELTAGGVFNAAAPAPVQTPEYGTYTLDFTDCSHGTLVYEFPGLGLTGEIPIQRVAPDNADLCQALLTQ